MLICQNLKAQLIKRFQHLPNIRSTKVERMLGKCWMNVEQSVEQCSNDFNTIQYFQEQRKYWMDVE